jgi:hypothetical protein
MKWMRLMCVCAFLAVSVQLAAHGGLSHSFDHDKEIGAVDVWGYIDTRLGFDFEESVFAPSVHSMGLHVESHVNDWLSIWITLEAHMEGSRNFGVELGGAFMTVGKVVGDAMVSFGLGLFDVPFGIASEWYCGPGNLFAYSPGITDEIFDHGWTDYGIFGAVQGQYINLTGFLVQGHIWEDDPFEDTAAGKGIAGGLRATLDLFYAVFGLSYALNGHYEGNNISFAAADVKLEFGQLSLAAQYSAMMPKFEFSNRRDTWFVQGMFDLEKYIHVPLSLGARFDYYSESLMREFDPVTSTWEGDAVTAITVQALYYLTESLRLGLSLRMSHAEHDNHGHDCSGHQNMLLFQVMAVF